MNRDELIEHLREEIAKRDARIVELESKTVRGFLIIDGMAFNPTEILSQNSDLCAAIDQRDQLAGLLRMANTFFVDDSALGVELSDEIEAAMAELSAIKAQEPVESAYRVSFYYLATGMEGNADKRDYGIVKAVSTDAAISFVLDEYFASASDSEKQFIKGCLNAAPAAPTQPVQAFYNEITEVLGEESKSNEQ